MRNSDLIVKQLLAAKNRLEKTKATAVNLEKRVQNANPMNRIPAVKSLMDIRILQNARGKTRKIAASDLLIMSRIKPKTASVKFCTSCGSKLAAGIAFCGECGTKVV
jgi:hypothetical protein